MDAEAHSLKLAKLGAQFVLSNNSPYAVLCFEAWGQFMRTEPLGRTPTSLSAVTEVLELYLKYGRVLRKAAQIPDLGAAPRLQIIFGLIAPDHWTLGPAAAANPSNASSGLIVLPHSFVYPHAAQEVEKGAANKLGSGGILLARQRVTELVSSTLSERFNKLLDVVLEAIDKAKMSSPFELCLRHIMNKDCTSTPEPCTRLHPDPENLNVQFFNDRVRLHLLVIAIFDQYVVGRGEVGEGKTRVSRQR